MEDDLIKGGLPGQPLGVMFKQYVGYITIDKSFDTSMKYVRKNSREEETLLLSFFSVNINHRSFIEESKSFTLQGIKFHDRQTTQNMPLQIYTPRNTTTTPPLHLLQFFYYQQ
uniref:Putative serine carboxypeptidase-like 26 n=1 Tax=Davidia involucrata TaxID=16924 RepID=A0A5B7BKB7_DAVIN